MRIQAPRRAYPKVPPGAQASTLRGIPQGAQGHTLAGAGRHPEGHRQASFGSKMRAQLWSFDFMASVTVFFMILIVLFFVWEYTTFQNTEQIIFNEMENKAMGTADMLIRTSGLPRDWNETNVQVLGLASEESVLNETKLLMFVNMDYDNTKYILGIPSHEFYFQLVHLNGTQAQSQGTDLVLGLDPTLFQNSSIVIPIERHILFDHRVAKLRFMLWR